MEIVSTPSGCVNKIYPNSFQPSSKGVLIVIEMSGEIYKYIISIHIREKNVNVLLVELNRDGE